MIFPCQMLWIGFICYCPEAVALHHLERRLKNMKKTDLAVSLSNQLFLSPHEAESCIDVVLEEIATALIQGHRVEIRGWGVFIPTAQRPRIARNPRNGQRVAVGERTFPHFKISYVIAKRLNPPHPQ
jgi:integration host factor subunit beta